MTEKRVLLPVLVLLLALAGGTYVGLSAATIRVHHVPTHPRPHLVRAHRHVDPRLTRRLRMTAWRWQAIVGRRRVRLTAPLGSPRAYVFWRRQARVVLRIAKNPPHKSAWLCIHRFEGSWGDSGDPYWGGLQMDRGFMSTYAPGSLLRHGWADRWTPLQQMWVAERAYRTRGFYPWPNTARSCGLI